MAEILISKPSLNIAFYRQGLEKVLAVYGLDLEKILTKARELNFIKDDEVVEMDLLNAIQSWSKTTRVGASTLKFEYEAEKTASFIYDIVIKVLKKISKNNLQDIQREDVYLDYKELANFKKFQKELVKNIEVYHENSKQELLKNLRIVLADTLIENLAWVALLINSKDINSQAQLIRDKINNLKNRIKLLQPNASALNSTAKVFDYTNEVNAIRNEVFKLTSLLKDYVAQHEIPIMHEVLDKKGLEMEVGPLQVQDRLQQLNTSAEQFSVIAKREADPYYDRALQNAPGTKVNTFERIRQVLRTATTGVGTICCVAALVCAFIPPAWGVGAILATVGMISLLPVADLLFEAGRNIWYGRSPNQTQVRTLGIAIPMIATIIFGLHAIPAIFSAVAGSASAITKSVGSIMTFIGKRILPGIFAVDNSNNFVKNVKGLKASSLNSSINGDANEISNSTHHQLNMHFDQLTVRKKPELKTTIFSTQPTEPKWTYHYQFTTERKEASLHQQIVNWKPLAITDLRGDLVKAAYQSYIKLKMDAPLSERYYALDAIKDTIEGTGYNADIATVPNGSRKKEFRDQDFKLLKLVKRELELLEPHKEEDLSLQKPLKR